MLSWWPPQACVFGTYLWSLLILIVFYIDFTFCDWSLLILMFFYTIFKNFHFSNVLYTFSKVESKRSAQCFLVGNAFWRCFWQCVLVLRFGTASWHCVLALRARSSPEQSRRAQSSPEQHSLEQPRAAQMSPDAGDRAARSSTE